METIDELEYVQEHYLKRGTSFILSQRLIKSIQTNKCLMTGLDKSDRDVIVLERHEGLSEEKFKKLMLTVEDGNRLEQGTMELVKKEITDEEFKEKCFEARQLCKKFVYMFYALEKLAFIVIMFSSLFAIFIESYGINKRDVTIICMFILAIIILNSFGDWGRLREKYARLHHMFRILSNSKEPDRIKKFQSYAYSFGTNDLFIDTIVLNDGLYEEILNA